MSRLIKPIDNARQSNNSDSVHMYQAMKPYACGLERRPGYARCTVAMEEVTCKGCLEALYEEQVKRARRILNLMGNIA